MSFTSDACWFLLIKNKKRGSAKKWSGQGRETCRFFFTWPKIIQIFEHWDVANKMQIRKLWVIPQTIFRAKKLETKSTTKKQENLKLDKVRFCPNVGIRKEKEDSWLKGIKTKIAFVKARLNFSSKSTTITNVHPMESLFINWLKNNPITVDILPCQSACIRGFLPVSVSNLLLNRVNPRRNNDTLASKELDTAFYKFNLREQLEFKREAFLSRGTKLWSWIEIKKLNFLRKLFCLKGIASLVKK